VRRKRLRNALPRRKLTPPKMLLRRSDWRRLVRRKSDSTPSPRRPQLRKLANSRKPRSEPRRHARKLLKPRKRERRRKLRKPLD